MSHDELTRRQERVRSLMKADASRPDALLITDYANIFYLTGRVFAGQIYLPLEGEMICFVRRPVDLEGDGTVRIRKPEEMAQTIGLNAPARLGLELDITAWSAVKRLSAVFPEAEIVNASPIMRMARAVKTDLEIEMVRRSGVAHEEVYSRIPRLYSEGMTDLQLQVEIERESRLKGCLGMFRISGTSMETFMGSLIAGDNADAPSPYDFAMGGAGLDPSLPVGANDSTILPGNTVMVDLNGNFTGYMTDMSRVYSLGEISELARKAHQCSIDIHRMIAKAAVPGTPAKALYEMAMELVKERGLENYYMGHRQQAGFIGHGVGIEINELPVIAPRSRDIIERNNVIALEPKFVIPHTGPVGIENTYRVTDTGLECLTNSPEEIISLI
ncbi:MAG: aminopeptidase P family protein [Bacteroides sp.]|nr:aminopeptidase P family protein [Bacteroidales bacterium]MBD5317253.1 aminopeptidase P family protein [Bacteroides sp.]